MFASHDRPVHVGLSGLLRPRLVDLAQLGHARRVEVRARCQDDQRRDRHREEELESNRVSGFKSPWHSSNAPALQSRAHWFDSR